MDCGSRQESNYQIECVLVLHTGVGNLDATVFHVLHLVCKPNQVNLNGCNNQLRGGSTRYKRERYHVPEAIGVVTQHLVYVQC